ncbi:MAG TPA: hypothetical protein VMX14_11085, partial [Anaerolineae bacterium]|nr:hypothetical protein [Anaerolineae bacterium]
QRLFDQVLGLWAGDQHPAIHVEIDVVETTLSREVGYGLMSSPSLHKAAVELVREPCHGVVPPNVELDTCEREGVGQEHFRIQARRPAPAEIKDPNGPTDGIADRPAGSLGAGQCGSKSRNSVRTPDVCP